MLYLAYQVQADMLLPLRSAAQVMNASMGWPQRGPRMPMLRRVSAALELFDRFALTHERPPFGIDQVTVGGRVVDVVEKPALKTPFGTLLHFRKDIDVAQPAVLLVAPLSGHFSTLLRNTVETLLPEHDVYITDWHNARDVPLEAGEFTFADYVDAVIGFLEHLGPGAHLMAVCQPCVQALVAVSLMAAENHPCQPRSMTLMGGPIDVRQSPTTVNALAFDHGIEWFEKNLITTVPPRYAGAGRRVYPGFVQLNAFMRMNMKRHVSAHRRLFEHLAKNEIKEAEAIKTFYDEYFAVLDIPAEFYIETIRYVFQDALLPKGQLTHRGKRVDPSKIKKTFLLTVEGERDDVCALGQTSAAHELCTGLRPYMKRHHLQTGVGHYGLFSGKRWETQIYPIVRNTILTMSS